MASQTSIHRLRKEFLTISRSPPSHITARPLSSNILTWYFILSGPSSTPYASGIYLGRLTFPSAYPYKPPAVYVLTPQGRYKPDTKLCLSMSDFHPETWSPAWSVGAVLTGLLTFMLLDEETVGSVTTSVAEKRRLARESHAWNRRSKIFNELFPEFIRSEEEVARAFAVRVKPGSTREGASAAQTSGAQGEGDGVYAGRRRGETGEKESLASLLAWLAVFVAILFYVWKTIAKA